MTGVRDDLAADLRDRVRHLRRTFGPDWAGYADPEDVSEVQALARVLDVPDPALPPLTTAHLPI